MKFEQITTLINEQKKTVYHAGTLEGKSDKFFQMSSPRSTGYFGTGYYFVTDTSNIRNFSKGKTVYTFNISGLKLAYGTKKLHQALKYLTFIVQEYEDTEPYISLANHEVPEDFSLYLKNALNNKMETFLELSKLGLKRENWKTVIYNLYKKAENAERNGDSISTMFMKSLGYQGVYPAPECDNTEFGGVIYDKENLKDLKLLS